MDLQNIVSKHHLTELFKGAKFVRIEEKPESIQRLSELHKLVDPPPETDVKREKNREEVVH